jgi:ABC-type transport system substrate-binding protein
MKKRTLFFLLILIIFSASINFDDISSENPLPVFYINFLSPNTSPARNQWALLMEDQLAMIGIGISFHESTGWGNIGPRTWSYPLIDFDYIPPYENGGYDLLFVGWSWPLDLNLQGIFETSALHPHGNNYYQYSNPTYDTIFNNYLIEFDPSTRLDLGYQLQAILYEDLPAIAILYPRTLFNCNTISKDTFRAENQYYWY